MIALEWFAAGKQVAPARPISHPLAGRPYHTNARPLAVAWRLFVLRWKAIWAAVQELIRRVADQVVAVFDGIDLELVGSLLADRDA